MQQLSKEAGLAKESFFDLYFRYVGNTEVPTFYNRWCPVACIGAMLGRQCWFIHGHWTLYPNMYVMLIGEPAARKTTAIGLARKMLQWTGYDRFSADKSSKERFLYDLLNADPDAPADVEEMMELTLEEPSERFVVADEFTDFVGKHNLEFLTMLSRLWDSLDEYKHPKLHGKSIVVPKPTVSILSASQPEMLYSAFPPEAIGQGIMSRFLMVYGEPTGKKITFPDPPRKEHIFALLTRLNEIKAKVVGPITMTATAAILLDEMYNNAVGVDDYRFSHYNNRRFTHLVKLSMILAAMDCRTQIQTQDAIRANTLLHVTESRMPRALGEFGKSKNSDIANKIISIMQKRKKPMTTKFLFKELSNDVERYEQLIDIMQNMMKAEKIKSIRVKDVVGFVPHLGIRQEWKEGLLDLEFLTAEEYL